MSCKIELPLCLVTIAGASARCEPHRARLRRYDCTHCPSQIQENQTIAFLCTLTPCRPGSFSLGFYVIDSAGPTPVHTNSTHFPNGSSVIVTDLEDQECRKLLTFVMSEPLNGKVLQCIAVGFHNKVPSIAHLLAMEGMLAHIYTHHAHVLHVSKYGVAKIC